MSGNRLLRSRAAVTLALVLLVSSLAGVASAAPVKEPFDYVGVSLYDLQPGKSATVVILGQIADDISLPAQVALSAPKGAELLWAGEVYPEDPEKDTVLEPEKREMGEYDLYILNATASRFVQLEFAPPTGFLVPGDGDGKVVMSWTAHEAVPTVRLIFELGTDRHAETLIPSASAVATQTEGILYMREETGVAAGQEVTFEGVIVPGLAPEFGTPEAAPAPPTQPVPVAPTRPVFDWRTIIIVALGMGIAVLVIAVVIMARRSSMVPEDDEDSDDIEAEPSADIDE